MNSNNIASPIEENKSSATQRDLVFVWINNDDNKEVSNTITYKAGQEALYGLDNIMNMAQAGGLGGKAIIYHDSNHDFDMLTSHTPEDIYDKVEFRHVDVLFDTANLSDEEINLFDRLKSLYEYERTGEVRMPYSSTAYFINQPAFAANIIKMLASYRHSINKNNTQFLPGCIVDMGTTIDIKQILNKNGVLKKRFNDPDVLLSPTGTHVHANATFRNLERFSNSHGSAINSFRTFDGEIKTKYKSAKKSFSFYPAIQSAIIKKIDDSITQRDLSYLHAMANVGQPQYLLTTMQQHTLQEFYTSNIGAKFKEKHKITNIKPNTELYEKWKKKLTPAVVNYNSLGSWKEDANRTFDDGTKIYKSNNELAAQRKKSDFKSQDSLVLNIKNIEESKTLPQMSQNISQVTEVQKSIYRIQLKAKDLSKQSLIQISR